MKILVLGLIAILTAQSVFADKIVMLEGTKESIEARKDFISSADFEIRAQYYTIAGDEVADAGLALLRNLAIQKPKVRVRIIVDALNNLIPRETMGAFLSDNQGNPLSNIEIKEYNNFKWYAPLRYTKRMHDKGLIIDNNVLISGGRNIANGYFGMKDEENPTHPIFEDTDILVLNSPAINEAATYFDDLWNSNFVKTLKSYEKFNQRHAQSVAQQRAELIHLAAIHKTDISKPEATTKWLSNKDIIQVGTIDYIFDNPVGQKRSLKKPEQLQNNISKQLYQVVRAAQKSVVIVTPYLVVTPEQEQLFKELRERKVTVRIFTNGVNSNDVPVAHVGYLNTRKIALKYGVQIWEYNGPDTLHAKMVIIDRSKMFIGSFNWDFRSQNLNREVGLIATLEENSTIDVDETDVFAKMSRIYERSTRIGSKRHLNENIGNDGEFNDDDISKLAEAIRKGNRNILFWQTIYPLIKTQL